MLSCLSRWTHELFSCVACGGSVAQNGNARRSQCLAGAGVQHRDGESCSSTCKLPLLLMAESLLQNWQQPRVSRFKYLVIVTRAGTCVFRTGNCFYLAFSFQRKPPRRSVSKLASPFCPFQTGTADAARAGRLQVTLTACLLCVTERSRKLAITSRSRSVAAARSHTAGNRSCRSCTVWSCPTRRCWRNTRARSDATWVCAAVQGSGAGRRRGPFCAARTSYPCSTSRISL